MAPPHLGHGGISQRSHGVTSRALAGGGRRTRILDWRRILLVRVSNSDSARSHGYKELPETGRSPEVCR